jgi:hypothetical protein
MPSLLEHVSSVSTLNPTAARKSTITAQRKTRGNNASMDDVSRHMEKMVKEMDERDVSVRCGRVLTKIKKIQVQSKDLKALVTSYPVKVADSCPLTLDNNNREKRNSRVSEMENEALRLQKMKKQAFLEKISREIKDKERLNSTKKKAPVTSATTIDELLKLDDEDKAAEL